MDMDNNINNDFKNPNNFFSINLDCRYKVAEKNSLLKKTLPTDLAD